MHEALDRIGTAIMVPQAQRVLQTQILKARWLTVEREGHALIEAHQPSSRNGGVKSRLAEFG